MQQIAVLITSIMNAGGMLPRWILPALLFGLALGAALRAAAWFTDLLEQLGDRWNFTPGLLSFVSALGANIPNYAASVAAFASGRGPVGVGIIIGSNIYNLAIILGLVAFAAPRGHGIRLTASAMRDARRVAWLAVAMGVTTWLALLCSAAPILGGKSGETTWEAYGSLMPILDVILNLLTLGLFLALTLHAMQRAPHAAAHQPAIQPGATPARSPSISALLARCLLALGLALAGVIVMVQAGLSGAADLHLPPALLSVVILAVATSLPNTVVAFELARTGQTGASLEEITSSNCINLALGCALPALLWSDALTAPFLGSTLLWIDLPLLTLLGLFIAGLVQTRHISRLVGVGLLGVYALWVAIHLVSQ
jgi:cation:H+ antiporter